MENLFSYGTLQSEQVQLAVFGRRLHGEPDALAGFKKESIKIKPGFENVEEHVAISYTGNGDDLIEGAALSVTLADLQIADDYETKAYKRIMVQLRSGKIAWTYVKNDKQ